MALSLYSVFALRVWLISYTDYNSQWIWILSVRTYIQAHFLSKNLYARPSQKKKKKKTMPEIAFQSITHTHTHKKKKEKNINN